MLKKLNIKNYALISNLNIDFDNGFSAITGETGAGKSIILGALNLLLGSRADVKSIKDGESRCTIEGTFSINEYLLDSFFETNDLDYDDECILRREVISSGKSRAFINDTPVSVNLLKELGKSLIDIHSQHQNMLINEEAFLLDTLDSLAHNDNEREVYQKAFSSYNQTESKLKALKATIEKNTADKDFIEFQVEQIENAALRSGEQEELEEEAEMLSHAEEIKQALFASSNLLNAEDLGCLYQIRQCLHSLESIKNVYAKSETLAERTESVYLEVKDISEEIEDMLNEVNFDPNRQRFVAERLDTIYSLEQKFKKESIAELLEEKDKLCSMLQTIDDGVFQTETLQKELQEKAQILATAGERLTETRKKAALIIEKNMTERLIPMGMPNVRFKVELSNNKTPQAQGFDSVCFFFSANKNTALQNISDIASGGEIARVMLSLKAIISKAKQLPTIIFDEIDTGVSGKIAERMAITMEEMSDNERQVISITHLPQIAARSSKHYKVYKEDNETGSSTQIVLLSEEERVKEIANMLSGESITEAAINNAKELLKRK